MKSTSFQSTEPTWKSFQSLARTRCSISVPPVPKRSSTKRFIIPATDFPVSGLPSMGSNLFSNVASPFDRARDSIEMLCSATVQSIFGSRFAHASGLSTLHNSIGQLAWEPCPNCTVLCPKCSTSVEEHIHAVSKFHQSCSNVRRMTCFWWQLAHNITIHTIRMSLNERCLEIDVKNVPTLAGCYLATHPKSGSCGSRRIGLLMFLLFILETSQYTSCLCLEEVTLFCPFF